MGAAMMEQFAARGDRVIATGRSATVRLADKKSSNIFPLDLDATAPLAVVREQIEKAIQVFGYIDFVVNNAGISVPQTIEEAEQKCYEQLRLCDEWEKVALSTTKDGADTTPNKYLLEKMSIMNLTK
ncbi:hypothetical protein Brms1b_013520 [Colletotrichum noveboracense]|nr:hypothetical protein Brms1b_013520 [Colletotrichum noveboracense]